MTDLPTRARSANDTEGAMHFDPPQIIDLDQVLGQCDWGNCDGETVALRWEATWQGQYLPVCDKHRSETWETDKDKDKEPR